jgi:hypothetical protein
VKDFAIMKESVALRVVDFIKVTENYRLSYVSYEKGDEFRGMDQFNLGTQVKRVMRKPGD